jgi:membrane protease YdiL (CAAX protease family)
MAVRVHEGQIIDLQRNFNSSFQFNQLAPFTLLVIIPIVLGLIVNLYLGIRHILIPYDNAWAQYCFMFVGMLAIGYFGTQRIYNQPLYPIFTYRKIQPKSLIIAFILLVVLVGIQWVFAAILTFSNWEYALYFTFAAVAEEVFFRVFLISFILKIRDTPQMRWIAIIAQAIGFVAIHQNYMGNPGMLVSVFVSGIILGIAFVMWKDPTANILAHLALNLIVVVIVYGGLKLVF